VENGLHDLSRETGFYELGPLRGQAHNFQRSRQGWSINPHAWDRRSYLTSNSSGDIFYYLTFLNNIRHFFLISQDWCNHWYNIRVMWWLCYRLTFCFYATATKQSLYMTSNCGFEKIKLRDKDKIKPRDKRINETLFSNVSLFSKRISFWKPKQHL